MKRLSIAALLLGAMSAPASAANPGTDPAQAASAQTPSASGDPNQVICEKVDKIGTRLGSSRVCIDSRRMDGAAPPEPRHGRPRPANPLPELGPARQFLLN